MRSVSGQVCHSLMVVSNCMPGSPQTWVPFGDQAHQVARLVGVHHRAVASPHAFPRSPSSSTARMKSSVTRTLLFEFWKNTDE